MAWIEQENRTVSLAPGEALRVRPGLIYSVSSGVVRLQCADSNRIIGFVSTCFEVPKGVSAYAHTPCRASWHYWHDLTPEQETFVRQMICQEYLWSLQHTQVLVGSSLEIVYAFLVYLGERFGTLNEDGYYEIPWVITQKTISETINATRVTVTRTFNKLKQTNLLEVLEDGKIRISPGMKANQLDEVVRI